MLINNIINYVNMNIVFDSNFYFSLILLLLIVMINRTIGTKKDVFITLTTCTIYIIHFFLFKIIKDGTILNLIMMLRIDVVIRYFSPLIEKLINYRPSKPLACGSNLSFSSKLKILKLKFLGELFISPVYLHIERVRKQFLKAVEIVVLSIVRGLNIHKSSFSYF